MGQPIDVVSAMTFDQIGIWFARLTDWAGREAARKASRRDR